MDLKENVFTDVAPEFYLIPCTMSRPISRLPVAADLILTASSFCLI